MKAFLFLKNDKSPNSPELIAEVDNLEVCPRGIYMVDGVSYQCTGQPTFIIEKTPYLHGGKHTLRSVELILEKIENLRDHNSL